MIPIQTTIVGYTGKPCSLFAGYDEKTNVLVISRDEKYRSARHKNCVVITNDPKLERDSFFNEEDLQSSIEAYYFMNNGMAADGVSPRLVFADKASRANPAQSIDKDGVNASGQEYRINEGITNAQIATLATCWYASQQISVIDNVLSMADMLLRVSEANMFNVDGINAAGFLTLDENNRLDLENFKSGQIFTI